MATAAHNEEAKSSTHYATKDDLKEQLIAKAISNEHKAKLQKSYPTIVADLQHVEFLVESLHSEGCITEDQHQAILVKNTTKNKVRSLLGVLEHRSEWTFHVFLQLLRISQRNPQLYNQLRDEDSPEMCFNNNLPPAYGYVKKYQDQLLAFHKEKIALACASKPNCHDTANYVNLTIYSGQLEMYSERIGHHEYTMQPKGRILAQIEPEELFNIRDIPGENGEPRTVMMIGVPGMGKTATCYFFLHQIVNQSLFENKFLFIFFIKLKEINLLPSALSFQDLLLDYYGPTIPNEDSRSFLWRYMMEHQEHILFLLDGFDEIEGLGTHFDPSLTIPFTSLDKPSRPEILINNLVKKNILPQSKVLVTSRPHCVLILRNTIDRLVELGGLNESQMDSLVTKHLKDTPQLQASVCEHIREQEILGSMFCIPAHVVGFLDYVKWCHRGMGDSSLQTERLPRTLAALLFILITMLLQKTDRELDQQAEGQGQDEEDILRKKRPALQKFAQLAFNGLLLGTPSKQLFTEDDLQNIGLTETDIQCGIMTAYVSSVSSSFLLAFKKLFGFLHLIQQEWLSAVCLTQASLDRILKLVNDNTGDKDVLLLLLVGLFGDPFCHQMIQCIYPEAQIYNWEEHARQIVHAICRSRRNHMPGNTTFALAALYESQQVDISHEILPFVQNTFGGLDISPVSPCDSLAISSFVSNIHGEKPALWLSGGFVGNKGLATLLQEPGICQCKALSLEPDKLGSQHYPLLSQSLNNTTSTLEHLRLRDSEPLVKDSVCQLDIRNNVSLQWMGLHGEMVDHETLKVTCDSLRGFVNLTTLVISGCPIGQMGNTSNMQHIQVLKSLNFLALRGCRLGPHDVLQIRPMVSSGQLEWLDLSGNAIGDPGVTDLAHDLASNNCRLVCLRLTGCYIEASGCRSLCTTLEHHKTLRILHLSQNFIGQATEALLELLRTNRVLEELYVHRCVLHAKSAVSVCSLLKQRSSLSCLMLSENSLDDNKLARELQTSLTRNTILRSLYLGGCNLRSNAVKALCKALKKNRSVKHLSICNNPAVCSRHIRMLIKTTKLNYLNISECNIDGAGFARVAKAICKNQYLEELCLGNRKRSYLRKSDIDHFLQGMFAYPQKGPLSRLWLLAGSEPDHSKMHHLEELLDRCLLHKTYDSFVVDSYTERDWLAIPKDKRQWLLYD